MTDPDVNPTEGPGSLSPSLLERVRARDQAAWGRFYRLYSPLVQHWCTQAGLQDADAADVVQEVFQAVARKIDDFRRDRPGDSFRGWLRVIVRNKVTDLFRGRAAGGTGTGGSSIQERWQELPSPDDAPAPAEETRLLYERALALVRTDFEESTWQAFWQVVVLDASPDEVAARLGMTPNAVYLAKSRVLRRLREEFVDLIEVGGS